MIGIFQLLLLLDLLLIGHQAELGSPYRLSVAGAAGFCLYQQRLIRDREPARCFQAFMNNNGLGFCVFAGVVADYWLSVG
jgi:4-hydroxybenzoate polyprenyltransferase